MTEENQSSAVRKHNNKWRVVDIVVAAIIAVASGVIFWAWDFIYAVPTALFDSLTPGLGGLFHFMWLFAGPLAAIIVRKPGAALFAETLAAFLELTLGNQWGVGGSLIVGIIQGLGAEIATPQFQGEFTGKKTLENGEVALGVVKNGKVEKPDYQVDGISGGTITSVGVDAMLKACLSSYKNFLTNNNEEE